jgi:hypothetical protein
MLGFLAQWPTILTLAMFNGHPPVFRITARRT